MANNFNFNTKLGLDANGFKQGVRGVQNSIRSLKSSFLSLAGALGAGLGFNQLISNLKNTATELSIAKNTLKNVSYVTKGVKGDTSDLTYEISNYQENLAFVKKLSNDYAQDLLAITDNYAKFTAACKKTDLALDDQRLIFESLTKAAAYYHLSADRTADMMNAVIQMMSKGKVAAEELRRQLGNTLPGAFNLMAAAMGVSNKKLDEMMRDGEVIASEVLPKFAAMLNTVTATAEFESLQASMNKLKNSWYEFVEKSRAEGLFKSIIDGSTKALSFASDNIKGIKASMWGLIAYFGSVNIFGHFLKQGEVFTDSLERDLKKAQVLMGSYNSEMKRLEKNNEVSRSANGVVTPIVSSFGDPHSIERIQKYNDYVLQAAKAQVKLGTITKAQYDIIQKEVNDATSAITGMAGATNTATASTNRWKTALVGVSSSFEKFKTSFANFFKSNWPFLLIGVLTTVVAKISQIIAEANRIKNITKDYANQIEVVKKNTDEEAAKLRNNLAIVLDLNAAESSRILALKAINKSLGLTGENAYDLSTLDKVKGKYEEITKAVEDWIEATKKQAIIQSFAGQIADATTKKAQLVNQKTEKEGDRDKWEAQQFNGQPEPDKLNLFALFKNLIAKVKIKKLNKEIEQYDSVIATAEDGMKEYGIALGDFFEILDENNDGEDGLSNVMKKYNKDTKELSRQLKDGAVTQEEYNKELNNIVQEAFKAAAATGEISMEAILKKQDSGKSLTALEKWYVELKDKALECARQVVLDSIAKSIIEDIDEALEKDTKELEKEFKKILENDEKRRKVDVDYAGTTSELKYQNSLNKRDGTFDYKKSKADIFGEEATIANDNLDRVMDKIKELNDKQKELMEATGQGLDEIAKKELSNLQEYYKQLSKEARTIEDAYRFEQIKEDIKEFEKEMTSSVFEGIENFASSLDRIVSGAKQLRDIIENTDSTGWEKIMGVVNYIFNILNAVTSVIETVNSLTEISNMLADARSVLDENKKANSALELETTVAQISAEQSLAAIKEKEAAFESTITANKVAQAEAIAGVTTALGAEAAAYLVVADAAKKAAAAAAAVTAAAGGPEAAIAAAETTLAGLTAVLSTFEHGGIVGGNSTRGDHNIIRANSGELILNKAQQGTLYRAIASGNLGGGGGGEWRVRGTDLIKVINNTQSKLRG